MTFSISEHDVTTYIKQYLTRLHWKTHCWFNFGDWHWH